MSRSHQIIAIIYQLDWKVMTKNPDNFGKWWVFFRFLGKFSNFFGVEWMISGQSWVMHGFFSESDFKPQIWPNKYADR